jgi:hypothetical protein
MHRFFPVALSNTARRLGVVLVTSLAAVTLASCGGGTQAKKFAPESLVVFGDDFSLITSDGVAGVGANEGATYGVAKFESGSAGPYDCRSYFNWVMFFANSVGFKFGNECNQALSDRTDLKTAVMLANDPVDVRVDSDTSVDLAYTNAGADAITARMHANLSLLNKGTLVTVNAGRADIVKAYRAYLASTTSLSVLEKQLEQTGRRFARSLKPVVNTGARVLLILSPGLGNSPLANTDGKKAELKALSAAFNKGLELEAAVVATGQQLGLVRLDQVLDSMVTQFEIYGTGNAYYLTNISASSCATPAQSAPLCVVPEDGSGTDASQATDYLWAGPTQVGNTSTMRDLFLTYVLGRLNAQPF